MAAISFFGIFVLLLLLIGVVAGGAAIVILLRRRKQAATGAPACGACGYEVAGLEQLRCPECGADLREVGIRTPQMGMMSARLLAVLAVLGWTLILPVPAIFLSAIAGRALPQRFANTIDVSISPAPGVDVPGARIVFTGRGATTRAVQHAEITLAPPAGAAFVPNASFLIGLDAPGSFAADGGPGRAAPVARAPTGEDLAAWLVAVGYGTNADAPTPRELGEELLRIARSDPMSVPVAPLYAATSTATNSAFLPIRWYGPLATLFWLAVWIAGVVLLLRRARA